LKLPYDVQFLFPCREGEAWIARHPQCRSPPRSLCPGHQGDRPKCSLTVNLEVRFAARPTNGPQVPHQRDELYFVASGSGHYRVEEMVTAVGPGDVLFCAAHVAHGFEDISEDFSVWVLFYGQQK
jgi:mannose-6-phosphate isomerase-like protein (cupin superfamily)